MPVLEVNLDQGVLRLKLNRPEKRNALSPELLDALRESLARARDDAAVRCVLIEGEGPVFCAGGDFDAMRERRGDALATKKAQDERFAALALDILMLEKPVVAHVNGDAFGAGLMLVLACDYAVAAQRARFAATFVKVGLIPDTAGTWLLPKTLGLRTARELAMLPDPVDAQRALDLRLVNAVREDAQDEALRVALRFATMPTLALGLAKRAIVLGAADSAQGASAREAALQGLLFTTADHAEGVDAFVQKRAPAFRGA